MASDKYTIDNKTIIFSSNFNEKMDSYYEVMKHVHVLIFDENRKRGIYSIFNQPIVLTSNITHVTLGTRFNQLIVLTSNIIVLSFGSDFDQPIELTPNITDLILSNDFNQPIGLTSNITNITFGRRFNHPIILTPRMTVLTFGWRFNQPIILSRRIIVLTFGECFNQPVILTPGIENITINCNNYAISDNLSNGTKYFILGMRFILPSVMANIPNSVKECRFL